MELGTFEYPYKMLDDPFREIFNRINPDKVFNLTIFIKGDSSKIRSYRDDYP